ncbi:MAG: hypothetical protein NDI66_06605 [Pseudomonas sp.]|nr:hypothetical protein [Pseudomonas sp.]
MRRAHAQLQAAAGRGRGVLRGQLAQQLDRVEIADLRLQRAGVEARDVEQAVEQVLGRAQRGVDALARCDCSVALSLSRSAEVNSRAAFSGCSTSCDTAARKRVFDCCAASGARVRCSPGWSSVSLTSRSACSARL